MSRWTNDGRNALAAAIVFSVALLAWMVRFETLDEYGYWHRNRITGAVCRTSSECWFTSERQ